MIHLSAIQCALVVGLETSPRPSTLSLIAFHTSNKHIQSNQMVLIKMHDNSEWAPQPEFDLVY